MSDTGPTGSTESTGPTGSTESTGPIGSTGMTLLQSFGNTEPVPDVLMMSDLVTDHAIVLTKELADKTLLETIGTQSVQALKPKLVEWYIKGCPNAYPILTLDIHPPTICSDGVVRDLTDYITFCSGKSIREHVDMLKVKLPDINVSFAKIGASTVVVVTKP